MFGDKQVLYQQVEEGDGGGGQRTVDKVTDAAAQVFGIGRDEGPAPENEAAKTETIDDQRVPEVGSARRTQPKLVINSETPAPKKAKVNPEYRIIGNAPLDTTTPEEQAILADATTAEMDFERKTTLIRAQAAGALSETMAAISNRADIDQATLTYLNNEFFTKAELENEELNADIDFARQMRIDPNNYMRSVGRAGRVASVFAVGVSQLAAGAGNVNSVLKRVNTAVERDIAAQQENLKQAWTGIKAKQNQQDRELNLLNNYFVFADKARAIAFTALSAQAGQIKMHAQSEGEYAAYDMVEKRWAAAAIVAKAKADANRATLYYDVVVKNAMDAQRKKKQVLRAGSVMSDRTGTAQPAQAAPGQQPQPTQAAPQPQRQTAPQTRASKALNRPQPQPTTAPQPSAGMTTMQGTEEAVPVYGGEEQPAAAPTEKPRTVAPTSKELLEEPYAKHGSRYNYKSVQKNINQRGPLVQQHIQDMLSNPGSAPHREQARDPEDAQQAALYDPLPPKLANESTEEFNRKVRLHRLRQEDLENYMAWMPGKKDQNFLRTKYGLIKLRFNATIVDDKVAREAVEDRVNKNFAFVNNMMERAQIMDLQGPGSLIRGAISFNKDGLKFRPGDVEAQVGHKLNEAGLKGLAMEAIKAKDPAGRLTDRDILVGEEMLGAPSGEEVLWHGIQQKMRQIDGYEDITDTQVKRSAIKVLRELAIRFQRDTFTELHNDIVMTPEMKLAHYAQRAWMENMVQSSTKEEGGTPRTPGLAKAVVKGTGIAQMPVIGPSVALGSAIIDRALDMMESE